MKYAKSQTREMKLAIREQAMHGEGLYVYRNNTSGSLDLPKPTASGMKHIQPGGEFQGDDYFMSLVRTNELKFVRTIMTPQQQKEAKMQQEKLLLDQPDTVTPAGKIEHVVVTAPVPLNETTPSNGSPKKDVLINEDPLSGVDILME